MVLKQRKQENKGDNGSIQQPIAKKFSVLDEREAIQPWSCWGVTQNVLKFSLFVLVVPAFLNFAALGREEKELKPEGETFGFVNIVPHLVIIIYILISYLGGFLFPQPDPLHIHETKMHANRKRQGLSC